MPTPPAAEQPAVQANINATVEAAALEQAMANAQAANQSASAATATRQSAQTDVAGRVATLQTQAAANPNPPVVAPSGAAPGYVPVPPPNSGISEKEQKLGDLLRRYQADEISPLEYHTERAKIIAEP